MPVKEGALLGLLGAFGRKDEEEEKKEEGLEERIQKLQEEMLRTQVYI